MTENWQRYLDLLTSHPRLIDSPDDADIELLFDEDDVQQVLELTRGRIVKNGEPLSWAELGVVFEDQYIAVLREPVRWRKSNSLGTYLRIVEKPIGKLGVVTFPVLNGELVMIRVFRHPIRKWVWELPRGFGQSDSPVDDAVRELKEEIDATVVSTRILGTILANSGMNASEAKLVYAELDAYGSPQHREAIHEVATFTRSQLDEMIKQGQINDSFTLSAFSIAQVNAIAPFGTHS